MAAPQADPGAAWTCPFCPLLCDDLQPRAVASGAGPAWRLPEHTCARAQAALDAASHWPAATPQRSGQPCTLDSAVAAAARLLAASRLPLFGGLGTDVDGARALYPLACATGAISDAGAGDGLMRGVRALQDRGGYSTTLAELRSRADLVLCFGGLPSARLPRFLARAGLLPGDPRLLVVAEDSDPFEAAATLARLVAGRPAPEAEPGLVVAAQRLHESQYAVLVFEPARLPEQGELVIEMLQRVVALRQAKGRAAALALGGGEGAATVNQVFTWLSGLPLRSRLSPTGLVHEPVAWRSPRLLTDGAVDLLLWIASFGTEVPMPDTRLPRIVLGHPGLAGTAGALADVFIPVATPGLQRAGHLFRTDGVVLMPLHALAPAGSAPPGGGSGLPDLPDLADVLRRITAALPVGANA